MRRLRHYVSPLGGITVASDGDGITGLWFDGQKYDRSTLRGQITEEDRGETVCLSDAVRWLESYFSGDDPGQLPPLHPEGSEFRQAVWKILLAIPRGEIVTYSEIAAKLAAERGLPRMSAQAVGGAVGHNPISILIPCHRVVGKDGSLTGYAGGLEKKQYLLRLEQCK